MMRLNRVSLATLAVVVVAMGNIMHAQAPTSTETRAGLNLAPGTTLNAVLNGSVDSKKVKVGDPVTAHTIEALTAGGKIVVPKGTRLVGHVTQASARGKGDPASAMGIKFDKAILKKNEEVPLNLWIRAIAAEPRVAYGGGAPDPNAMAGPGTAAAAGSPMKQAPPPIAQAPSSAPSAPEPSEGAGLNAAGMLPPNSHGVYGLEGLKLSTDGSNAQQGPVISGSGKSVQLEGGTRLLLASQ